MRQALHLLAWFAWSLLPQAFAHGPSADYQAQAEKTIPAEARELIAARYIERWTDNNTRSVRTVPWYFWREAERIETASPEAKIAEIWERDADGRITHARYFHEDRRVIETTTGELKARGIEPDWQKLGTLLDPRTLPGMRRVGAISVLGRHASIYRGKSASGSLEVVWLDAVGLPARITRSTKAGSVTLRLKELHHDSPPDWPRVDLRVTENYQRIDTADLGDMENDPFVRKVLGMNGGHGGHQH